MSDSGGLSDSSKESPPPSSNQTSPPPSSNQTSPPIDNSPPSGGGSSNSAPPPTSHSSSAPPPEAHSSSSSPPAPHSSSAPPLSSNPISPPAPATSQNSSSPPPPQLSSPPPFNSTLPTPSPPPNSPPPESPKSSPPSISTPSPPATQNFSLPPPSPSYSPPPPAEKSPPPPETPPSSGGGGTSSPSPPPAEFAPPPPVRFSSPPALEVSKSLPPQVALSPPAIPSPDKATESSSSLQPPSSFTPKSSSSTPSLLSPRSSEQSDSGKGISHVTIAAVTVTGVAIIALVAVVLLVLKRRKRKDVPYNTQYKPSNNYTAKSDGYYYGPQPNTGNSAQMDPFYGSHPTHSPTGLGNTYGNPQGQGYPLGGYDSSGGIGGSKSFFTYEEMMTITNGFSRQNIIGEGGFGCVYKGLLTDGKPVAVKQLKAGSGQGEREFQAEVDIISRVHHRHLVTLVGYCISEHHRLLIYEFVPNKTLEHHLHGKELPLLDWAKRVKIALGAARGLAYLHEDCHPKIIHRDIKSANILLDDSFEAKVADFGLAKLNIDANTHVSTRVMGTFGYMAPEYAASGKLTDRSDVFSFGVVLLELITGRKPIDSTQPLGDESLVEWARPLLNIALQSGDFSQLLDPRLEKMYVEREVHKMIDVAAACVRHSALKRPRMVQVVRSLDSEGDIHDLSNGMKYGQSTAYDSAQYSQDIRNFRRTVFGSTDDSEFDAYPSGDYSTREPKVGAWGSEDNSSEFTSRDSETRAIKSSEARLGTDNYEGSRPAA